MKLKYASLQMLVAVLLTLAVDGHGAEKSLSVDGTGAFSTGHYRNLFVEAGHSENEVRQKIDSPFQQLFHGNLTNETIYYEAGSNSSGLLAFTTDIKHHDVRTEGLSYGMIIAVEL